MKSARAFRRWLLPVLLAPSVSILAQRVEPASDGFTNTPLLRPLNVGDRNLLDPRSARLGLPETSDVENVGYWTADKSTHTSFLDEGPQEFVPPPPDEAALPRFRRLERAYGSTPKNFTIDAVFFGRSGVDLAGATSVQMTQIGLNYTARFPFGDRFVLTLRPLGDVLFLQGPGGTGPILPPQVYKVAMDFQGDIMLNNQWGVSIGVTPGLWTDFVRFSGKDFRIPARLLLTYRYSETVFLAGGIMYTDNIQRNAFPCGGVIWDISERMRLELLFPRTRYVYKVSNVWEVYGVLEGYGSTYNITTAFPGQIIDDDFLYRDFRVMLGTQVDIYNRATLFTELGGVFCRKMKFDTPLQPTVWVNPAFILRVGVRF